MTIEENIVESFAEHFYRYHEALAPDFGCGANEDLDWDQLTANERRHFMAAARLAFMELQSQPAGSGGAFYADWPTGGTEGRECGS